MNSYELSKNWFNWCFENPEKIRPNHTALYFYIVDQCNRLGWKEKFGLPMQMAKDAIGISNYRTYAKTFEDLTNWGFIQVYQKSKNQHSATVIGIAKNTKAIQKQSQSTVGVYKPLINYNKRLVNAKALTVPELNEFLSFAKEQKPLIDEFSIKAKYDSWIENDWQDGNNKKIINWKTKLKNTLPYLKENNRLTENQHNKRKTF